MQRRAKIGNWIKRLSRNGQQYICPFISVCCQREFFRILLAVMVQVAKIFIIAKPLLHREKYSLNLRRPLLGGFVNSIDINNIIRRLISRNKTEKQTRY